MTTSATSAARADQTNDNASGCQAEPARDSDVQERSIPIRPGDLNRLLMGQPDLSAAERAQLGQFAKLLDATFHHEFRSWLVELKDRYAPFDPDTDCVDLDGFTALPIDDGDDEQFFKPFEAALIRANYRPLKLEVIEEAIAAPNEKGLTYVPDFSLFEHMKVYVRGSTKVSRFVRNFQSKFRKSEVIHDGYARFVVALKFKSEFADRDSYVRSDVIYLRLFKDVPYVDMEMHLPEQGIKVKMRLIDKAQVASPLVVFPATVAMKAVGFFIGAMSAMPRLTLGTLLIAPVSAGINSFFGFKRAQRRHLLTMIRHLYYLTLANNASVIECIIGAAEEEEYKEALLAYYALWRKTDDDGPWNSERLDQWIEHFLRTHTGLDLDFEVADALHKLTRLGIARTDSRGSLTVAPIEQALAILDGRWDRFFRYAPEPSPAELE